MDYRPLPGRLIQHVATVTRDPHDYGDGLVHYTFKAADGTKLFTLAGTPDEYAALVPHEPSQVKLTVNGANAVASNIDPATVTLHWALAPGPEPADADSYADTSATATAHAGTAGDPYVDVLALDAAGKPIGTWAGRVKTEQAPAPPPPPASGTIVALQAQNYGSGGIKDVTDAVKVARVDVALGASFVKALHGAGLRTCLCFSGPYNSGGVSALDADQWVSNTLAWYEANTDPGHSPWVEVLNEPGGSWFWGSNANSQTNADAYRALVKKTYDAFHAQYGSSAPKILGDYYSGADGWGRRWASVVQGFCDGMIVHPYGGTGSRTTSAQGDRSIVTEAHTFSGLPVFATEVGWPTATSQGPTGDSLQWSEADQATNIVNFVNWCKSTGYVSLVSIFCQHDYGSNAWYGVVRNDNTRKPSHAALASVA